MLKIGEHSRISETEIISRIIDGDMAVFEILIRRYNPYLYKIGRSYGFNHQDVEDLMQETLINVYNNLRNLDNPAFFKTWITRIMLNECYRKHNRSSTKREFLSDTFFNDKTVPMFTDNKHGDTEKTVGNRELHTIIEKAVAVIPLDYRLVFSLRELIGLTVHETAATLKITETNVKVRLNRAKALLRKEVEKMYTPEEIFEFNLVYCDAVVESVMKEIADSK